MATFSVVIRAEAQAEFLAIPFPFRRQVNQLVYKLKNDPLLKGAQLIDEDRYRITSHGWTILYEVDAAKLLITIAGFRPATAANDDPTP